MKTHLLFFSAMVMMAVLVPANQSSGQTSSSVTWNLIAPDTIQPSAIVGPLTGFPIRGSGFDIRSYSGTPNGPLGTTNMRWWPTGGASWGLETDEVAYRYIELSAAPKTGSSFAVDSISFWTVGGGTSGMRLNVYYATDTAFTTKRKLNPGDTAIWLSNSGSVTSCQYFAFPLNATIPSGKTLYFRIYPWYTGAASTSKYVYTQLAVFKGKVATSVPRSAAGTTVPDQFVVNQNYPNPFNPSTKISFGIPAEQYVSVKVFNLIGQEVATVFEGLASAGYHEMNFDAAQMNSGMYLYRIQAGNSVDVKRMMFLK